MGGLWHCFTHIMVSTRWNGVSPTKNSVPSQVDLNLNWDWSKICESGDKPLARFGRGPLGSVLFGQEIGECKGSNSGTKWAVNILEMTVVDTQFSPKSCWAKLSWAVASFAISCNTPISPHFAFLAQHPRIDHYTLVRSLIWMVDSAFFSIVDAQQFFDRQHQAVPTLV